MRFSRNSLDLEDIALFILLFKFVTGSTRLSLGTYSSNTLYIKYTLKKNVFYYKFFLTSLSSRISNYVLVQHL